MSIQMVYIEPPPLNKEQVCYTIGEPPQVVQAGILLATGITAGMPSCGSIVEKSTP